MRQTISTGFSRRLAFVAAAFAMLLNTFFSPQWLAVHVSASALAAPPAGITEIRPLEDGGIVYEPLAPKKAGAALTAQLTIDVVIENQGATQLDVDKVWLVFSGGSFVLPVELKAELKKLCEGDETSALVKDNPTIGPGIACRLMLLPDTKLPMPSPTQVTIKVYFKNYVDPLVTVQPLKAHRNPTPTGSYFFPAKASDLEDGEFWSGQSSGVGSHHRESKQQFYAYDMGVARWDENLKAWVNKHPGQSGKQNDDYLVWNKPVYAMADGEVVDYAVGNEDNAPFTPDEDRRPANLFKIKHGDELALYAHLQNGTVNLSLTQKGAKVTAGQYLGRVGNSGKSDWPHLHVHVEKNSVGRPLLFQDIFLLEEPSMTDPFHLDKDWTPVVRQGLPWEKNKIWPAPFYRRSDGFGTGASEIAMANTGETFVTAVRDGGGNLGLVSWTVSSASGEMKTMSLHYTPAGAINKVAIANPGSSSEVVTAVQLTDGTLKLIAWDITALQKIGGVPVGGAILRQGEAVAGPVSRIAMTGLPTGGIGVITAVRDGNSDLKLIAWEVTAVGGQIIRKGSITGAPITEVALTEINNPFSGVVAACRDSLGNLKLMSYQVTTAKEFVFKGQASAGAVALVSATTVRVSAGKQYVVTAVRLPDGRLEMISWDVLADGQIVRKDSVLAGTISEVAVQAEGNFEAVTAVRLNDGSLKLIAWEVTSTGQIIRKGEDTAGAASKIALVPFVGDGKRFMVTAVRTGSGALKVTAWETNLTP
jgi:hypothetical protein